jgi:hypothetical protein
MEAARPSSNNDHISHTLHLFLGSQVRFSGLKGRSPAKTGFSSESPARLWR